MLVTNWPDKDSLPSAQVLHDLLQRGISCSVCGHSFSSDEHGVWITNPYGVDGLWQELTLKRVEQFLVDMALDKEYSVIP